LVHIDINLFGIIFIGRDILCSGYQLIGVTVFFTGLKGCHGSDEGDQKQKGFFHIV